MATVFPYTKNINRFRTFFAGIPERGRPDKINQEYLKKLGYKSSNEQTFPTILKFIGLLDNNNSPNSNYDIVRNKTGSKELMANLIGSAYKELFDTYPNAQNEDDSKIIAFMKPYLPRLDETTIGYYARTFKVLCEFADFKGVTGNIDNRQGEVESSQTPTPPEEVAKNYLQNFPLALNVNIQIELPNTSEYLVYEKIFEAIRRNLIDKK
ncbi:MAG TPA: DUF5343 domain-containing protein [Geobacterales bacterium]|nr:DUF5343 domain-containing protein [Geobacterales bacterium]